MKNIITIGAGVAGIEVSNQLANLGYNVTIIEKDTRIGGNVKNWSHLFPDMRSANDIKEYINIKQKHENITLRLNSNVDKFEPLLNNQWYVYSGNIRYTADAIVIATGYDLFDATRKEEYGYKIYPNVITSADLEKLFEGNTKILTQEGKIPEKIAIVHCVGSRDEKSNNHYCSKVCCITGVKQAIEINKHLPNTQVFCFYMDLRMFDKHFEELYRTAQEHHNIQFIRGRVSEVSETFDKRLLLKTEDTLSGRPLKMNVDMIVLLVGMEAKKNTAYIANILGLEKDKSGFLKSKDLHISSNLCNKKGIFLAGTCIAPMSIKDTLENSRSAAFEVHNYLKK